MINYTKEELIEIIKNDGYLDRAPLADVIYATPAGGVYYRNPNLQSCISISRAEVYASDVLGVASGDEKEIKKPVGRKPKKTEE